VIDINKIKTFTESDVEMHIILPLLTNNLPNGLGYKHYNIQTKHSIKKILIDKGNSEKLYYPDFAIIVEGLPLVIIEAKKPGENLDEAYRQACLYANEINRQFGTLVNPCKFVIATDGLQLFAGNSDSNPSFKIEYNNWLSTNVDFDNFLKVFDFKNVEIEAKKLRALLGTESKFKNPITLIGGKKIQNLESNNSFGESISIQYEHLFNPKLESEKENIVKNAYVKQNKLDAHIKPIDSIFERKIADLNIKNVGESDDLLEKFKTLNELNNKVLLLIGSVGAGKSTFTSYLKEVALNEEIRNNTFWVNLNLNDSPLNREEIYKWVKANILKSIKENINNSDFDDIDYLMSLYSDKISALKKGVLKLFSPDDIDYKRTLADSILSYQNDIDLTLSSIIEKEIIKQGKSLVVVLDNCDKRNSEEQLLMFEVANWIKDNIKCIVFLPLRETTYDNHKYEKPLDTVIKDLIFKINAPSLEQVLQHRISYINSLNKRHKEGFYILSNGIKVKIPTKDEEKYLHSILESLFENQFFKTLISGFAGRNIRNGIEIFLDFCKSGHINETEITKMINSARPYILPNHLISKVFIRGNRVYYTDENSRVKNLFFTNPRDTFKDPFIRVSLLKYLFEHKSDNEFKNFEGYLKTEDVIKYLSLRGHDENTLIEQLKYLLKINLIENETLDSDAFNINDLIKITSIGIAHLRMIRNTDYLAAIAEDFWYRDGSLADNISNNMAGNGEYAHLSIQNTAQHARKFIEYLENYYNANLLPLQTSISLEKFDAIEFDQIYEGLTGFEKNIKTDTIPNLEVGKIYDGNIVNIQNYGIMCEIVETDFYGLLHTSVLPHNYHNSYKLGMKLKVKIKEFVSEHNKYNLELAK